MKYRDFSAKSKLNNFTVSNNENKTFGFSLFVFFFSSCPKDLNVVNLSEITATTLTFGGRTADVTYCADVRFFLQATSGGLSLTAAFFSAPISCILLLEILFVLTF